MWLLHTANKWAALFTKTRGHPSQAKLRGPNADLKMKEIYGYDAVGSNIIDKGTDVNIPAVLKALYDVKNFLLLFVSIDRIYFCK